MRNFKQTTLCILLSVITVFPIAKAEDLSQTYALALENDPILRAENAAFEAATHSQRSVKALYFPSVNFDASYSNTDQDNNISNTSGSFTSKSYSLSLRQAIYRKDYLTQLKQAQANTRLAEALLNTAQQDLIMRVATKYFDMLAAQDSLEFAQAEKNAIARQLEQTKQRFEVGLIAITDVHESQAAFDLATASEIVAQNRLQISIQALREITGQKPQSPRPLGKELQLISPDPTDINQWISNAEENSFAIIAADATVEAAQQYLEQQRSSRHPTLDLVASRNHSDSEGGTFGAQDTDSNVLSLQLNVPLYLGGRINANISQSRAALLQARAALEQQRRATQRQVSDAYLGVLSSISRVKALNQAVISSQSALNATEADFNEGYRTTVDVLNARRELFRAQRDYARARYDYILARLALKNSAGLLDKEDIAQINAWLKHN